MKKHAFRPASFATPDNAVHLFARKLSTILTVKYSLSLMTLWCFIWGLFSLVARAMIGVSAKFLLFGFMGIFISAIAGFLIARKQSPPRSAIRSFLDQQNDCGGLLMAADEQPLGDWQTRMQQIGLPQLRWRNKRAWGLLLVSIVFIAVCLLVPVRFISIAGRPLNIGKQADALRAQIETLSREQIITEAKADELKDKLYELQSDASGEDPAKTWEALDHLADSIEKTAQETAADIATQQEKLNQAEALTEGLMAGSDQLDAKTMTEAMQTLSKMMQEAMKENETLANNLSPEIREAIKNGSLKPEQLKDLANALGQNRQKLNQQLSKLNQSGLNKNGRINPNSLKGGAQAGLRDNSGLSQFLKENAQKMSVEDAVGQWCEGGKGGVNRGRGDAAMTWTEGSDEKNAKFKEKALPPSSLAGLQDSQMIGLSAAAPEVQQGNLAAHGALNNAASGGGSAYTQTILPRHKSAVKRYFERNQK